jgi:hypothetical protein
MLPAIDGGRKEDDVDDDDECSKRRDNKHSPSATGFSSSSSSAEGGGELDASSVRSSRRRTQQQHQQQQQQTSAAVPVFEPYWRDPGFIKRKLGSVDEEEHQLFHLLEGEGTYLHFFKRKASEGGSKFLKNSMELTVHLLNTY